MNDLSRLGAVVRVLLVVAFVSAVVGAFVPGRVGAVAAVVCVAVLVTAPALRVGWLTVGWARQGDRRFALSGVVLLTVLLVGGVVALV